MSDERPGAPSTTDAGGGGGKGDDDEESFPPVDFTTLVLSMSTSCMIHLGEVEGPEGTRETPDLALARQSLDILEMLEMKTQGNLTGTEERILDQVLQDLREAYDRKADGA
ncbi:MAG: DUF1844 domain-containing protein [Sandaracinaceae bacterium]